MQKRNSAMILAALWVLFGSSAGAREWSRAPSAEELILPEVAMKSPESATIFLSRIAQRDPKLAEEDLLAVMLVLLQRDMYWLVDPDTSAESDLCRNLVKTLLAHPKWMHGYDDWLKFYVTTIPAEETTRAAQVVREHFGLSERKNWKNWWQVSKHTAEYAMDGSWLDWLKPAARDWKDMLRWESCSHSGFRRLGWFEEPPCYALPFKGRIRCALETDGRPGLIFGFDSAEELRQAELALNGGLDTKLYAGVPDLLYVPNVRYPTCRMQTYANAEDGCYLLAVSSYVLRDSLWDGLPDSLMRRHAKKGAGR